jgi:D-alanyl-D-alanine carboxypeptidase
MQLTRWFRYQSLLKITSAALLTAALLSGCEQSATDPGSGKSAQAAAAWTIEPAAAVLAPGGKLTLKVAAVAKDGSKKELGSTKGITYVSSNPAVAAVSDDGTITAAAQARTGSDTTIKVQYQGVDQDIQLRIKYALEDTITVTTSGKEQIAVVTNPEDMAVVVNKNRSLPATYVPPSKDMKEPNVPFSFKEKSEKKLMRSEAAQALEKLFDQAAKDNIKLAGVSAYRSYVSQKSIFAGNVKSQGEKQASQYSARPGLSEHQTGLAIDVSSPSVQYALEESFGDTKEGKWLVANAPTFGFILRYMKGKEALTGYSYEPWHIRYIGVEMATEISKRGITLEEYFQDAVPVSKAAVTK